MFSFLDFLFYSFLGFLSLVWIGLVAISLGKSREQEVRISKGFNPRVLVVVPFKGKDIFMEKGLRSLMNQSYDRKKYDVVAVADSASDAGIGMARKTGVRIIVRKPLCRTCSNKVMSLMTAFRSLKGYGAYVVADSDTICSRDWLAALVLPLSDKRVGVATAFPFFKPVKGSGFWTKVKMVWGFVGNGLMESSKTRFAWGGSMAFRKELLDRAFFKSFGSSVSDDIAITKAVLDRGLRVYYVNKHIVGVPSDDTFGTFVEWSNRQTAFTLIGYKNNFKYGVAFYGASILLLVSALLLSVFYSVLCVVFLVPFFIGLAKTYKRSPNKEPIIAPIFFIINFIYLANLIAGRWKKEIVWRGIRYRLR